MGSFPADMATRIGEHTRSRQVVAFRTSGVVFLLAASSIVYVFFPRFNIGVLVAGVSFLMLSAAGRSSGIVPPNS